MSETRCYAPDCDGIAELGSIHCWRHIAPDDDWVERLRGGDRTAEEAEPPRLVPGMRVRIMVGRFAGMVGRLTGLGPELAGVDLGVAIDGGNGIVSVPVSALREVQR
jgi:transcription antitermination factor NusG